MVGSSTREAREGGECVCLLDDELGDCQQTWVMRSGLKKGGKRLLKSTPKIEKGKNRVKVN